VVAVPIGYPDACPALEAEAGEVVCALTPKPPLERTTEWETGELPETYSWGV
jgi:predicted phosphoribosyltransferase